MKKKDNVFVPVIIALSIIIPLAVAALMYIPETLRITTDNDLRFLPTVHAVLNGSTAILLVLGYYFIKNKNSKNHRIMMMTAFIFSSVFLVSYVASKLTNDPISYGGEGFLRYLYFFILISHIALSVPVLPLALFSMYRGMTGEIEKHKKIVKWTFPIWMYVTVTGVLVYLFMYPYY